MVDFLARGAKPGVERLPEILPARLFAALELGVALFQPGGAFGEFHLSLVERPSQLVELPTVLIDLRQMV